MGELETKIKKPSFFKKLGFLALNILLLTTFYNVRAADGISAQIVADPAQAAVGDVVSLTVQVNHPAGYRTVPVQLISEQSSEYGAWGPFEVRGQYPLETIQDSAGGEISRQIIEVTLSIRQAVWQKSLPRRLRLKLSHSSLKAIQPCETSNPKRRCQSHRSGPG